MPLFKRKLSFIRGDIGIGLIKKEFLIAFRLMLYHILRHRKTMLNDKLN
jgi:hypothetical protein